MIESRRHADATQCQRAAPVWTPPALENERARLADLKALNLHRLAGVKVLQTLVSAAARVFDAPIAAISLVGECDELFLAAHGATTWSGRRTEAFCAHTIAIKDVLVIEDATTDDRFADHPKVVSGEVRFYAGAPIFGVGGQPVGALCVRDAAPHAATPAQLDLLRHLASLVTYAIRAEMLHEDFASASMSLAQEEEKRVRLQSQLLQAHKLESIGQLASGIAHEINTPTQYISDNVRFLQEQFSALLEVLDAYAAQLDPNSLPRSWADRANDIRTKLDQLDYDFVRGEIPLALEQSLEGLERVTTIVGAMKDFSHPGSTEKELSDLNHLIETSATVCRNRWKYVADLDLDLDPTLPLVPCNAAEINQVILNLLINAADAIAEHRDGIDDGKGRIRVRTHHDGGHAVLIVEDDGIGIEGEHLDRIFDPFFTTKQVGVGTGQGLAICRNVIVDKHQGSIDCASAFGEGSKFIVTLPLAESQEGSRAA